MCLNHFSQFAPLYIVKIYVDITLFNIRYVVKFDLVVFLIFTIDRLVSKAKHKLLKIIMQHMTSLCFKILMKIKPSKRLKISVFTDWF